MLLLECNLSRMPRLLILISVFPPESLLKTLCILFFIPVKTMKGKSIILEFSSQPTITVHPAFLLHFILPPIHLAPVGAIIYWASGVNWTKVWSKLTTISTFFSITTCRMLVEHLTDSRLQSWGIFWLMLFFRTEKLMLSNVLVSICERLLAFSVVKWVR